MFSKGTNLDCSTRSALHPTGHSPFLPFQHQSRPQDTSAHDEERDRELWGTLEQDLPLIGFSKKTIKKVFLIGPFKFARERLNVRRAWRVSGFFPRDVEVNAPGRWALPAYS